MPSSHPSLGLSVFFLSFFRGRGGAPAPRARRPGQEAQDRGEGGLPASEQPTGETPTETSTEKHKVQGKKPRKKQKVAAKPAPADPKVVRSPRGARGAQLRLRRLGLSCAIRRASPPPLWGRKQREGRGFVETQREKNTHSRWRSPPPLWGAKATRGKRTRGNTTRAFLG